VPQPHDLAHPRHHVVVAGWSGTTNLGDELLLRALLGLLAEQSCTATVVSRSPHDTMRLHNVDAVGLGDAAGLVRRLRASDGLVLGPGTLIQDQTSPASLPWHLGRVATARAVGRPVAGIGLGAGPLRRPGSRAMTGTALRHCAAVSVRDDRSAALLAACGVRGVAHGCDLALALDPPIGPLQPRVAVSLRAHHQAGSLMPLRHRVDAAWDPVRIAGLAAALDDVASRTGLPLHLVAMDTDDDARFHAEVARHLRSPHTTEVPDLDTVVAAIATSQLVVAMRYHAGIAAVIGQRPVALVGYATKVDALAAELAGATGGPGVVRVDDNPDGWAALGRAAGDLHASGTDSAGARQRLHLRLDAHRQAIASLLAAR
jgi:polysaccharide pyruvyl transferase CsaB